MRIAPFWIGPLKACVTECNETVIKLQENINVLQNSKEVKVHFAKLLVILDP